jgi:hypothetical protein
MTRLGSTRSRSCITWLALALGCGGGAGDDCARLCARVAECGGQVGAAGCQEQCATAVGAAGEVGRVAVAACADCVVGTDCLALAGGTCDQACPTAGLPVVGVPPGGCAQRWDQGGASHEVRCEPGDSGLDCTCWVDGVAHGGSFTSLDFCSVDEYAQLARAMGGCGFSLSACAPSFVVGGVTYNVSCDPEGAQFSCFCDDSVMGRGQWLSTDFCRLDSAAQQSEAAAPCGYQG